MTQMFNLKNQKNTDDKTLLRTELEVFKIVPVKGKYKVTIGDEKIYASSLAECLKFLDQGLRELREHIFESWDDLAGISQKITSRPGKNDGGLDNLLFLNEGKV